MQVSDYLMERYQQKTLHYFRGVDWTEGNVWNCLMLFEQHCTVPLLGITLDYAKNNVFTVWWYLPYNKGSWDFDVTFEDDMKDNIAIFKPDPYSDGLWNGLLEQGYLHCERKKRK